MFKLTVFNCIFVFSWLYRYPTVAQIGDTRCCRKVADVAFVVDTSSSIYIEDFILQLKAIHAIVDLFDVGPGKARFAAVSFSDRVVPQFHFNSFSTRSQVLDAIDNIRYPGGQLTCLNLGIEYMRRILFNSGNGARHGVPQVVVVFTDGNINCGYDSLTSTKAKEDTIEEADFAKKSGLSMFAVGIGPNVNINVLKAIASAPVNRFMQTVPSDSKMDTTEFRHFITNNICTGCDITPLPTLKPVITDARISPPTRSLPVYTRISPATRPPPDISITTSLPRKPCPPACQKKTAADIYFVLDESTSIYSESDFRSALVFVEEVTSFLQIGLGTTKSRTGMIRYSDRAYVEFPLDRYTTKAQVQNAVRSVTYKGAGATNTHMALQLLRSLFTPSYWTRNNVAQIAIIITDGKSTNPYKTREESQLLQRMGIYSFAMGYDYFTNEQELDVIATCDLYKIKIDYFASSTINRRFADILCNDAHNNPQTRSPPGGGISPPTRPPPVDYYTVPGRRTVTTDARISPSTRSPLGDTSISPSTRSPPAGPFSPPGEKTEPPPDLKLPVVRLNCTPGNVENDYCNRCVYNSKCELVCTKAKCMIQKRLIDKVNTNRNSWKATAYRKFLNLTLEYAVMTKLGTRYPTKEMLKFMKPTPVYDRNTTLPNNFDAREKWPDYIHPPEDQGNCNGSWAFSTAGAVADRIAIQSKGDYTRNISVSHLLSCALKDDGCSAGSLDIAWQYITTGDGILVSECYTRVPLSTVGMCHRSFTAVGSFCPDEFLLYIKMTPPKRIANKEEDIMADIMKNGPVQTIINVKEDFFMYKSGIYRYSTNSGSDAKKLYHSVKIIGWGEKKIDGETVKYWVCANSWGVAWGEDGYFKIERSTFENFTLSANLGHFVFVENQDEPDCNRAPKQVRDLHNNPNNPRVKIVRGGGSKSIYSLIVNGINFITLGEKKSITAGRRRGRRKERME